MDLVDAYNASVGGRTHIVYVLDQSGSMKPVEEQTISGFNEQVQMLKSEQANNNVSVSLIKFNHTVNPVFLSESLDSLQELTSESYKPNGGTAMYDAVGYAIEHIKSLSGNENDSILVTIISDGEENSSKEYTQNRLAELIQQCNSSNKWTFAYMGANQDLSKISENLNIKIGNMASYTNDVLGTKDAFTTMSCATKGYMRGRADGQSATLSFYDPDSATDE